MSEGPIAQWWKSHEPATISTPNAERICLVIPPARRTYCGRKTPPRATTALAEVKCADCSAALRADQPDS